MNILFVCTANVSRSFFAEKLFRHEASHARLNEVSVRSAGLFTYPDSPSDPKMCDHLADMDVDHKGHLSRQMTEADVEWADLILVMEKMHYARVEGIWPQALGKVDLLGRFVAGDQVADDIADPYGRSDYHYRLAQSQMTLAVRNLIQKIEAARPLAGLNRDDLLRRIRGK